VQVLTEYFQRRQKEGELQDFPPAAILAAAAGMAQNYAVLTQLFGISCPGLTDEQVLDSFVAIVMNGIQKTP
jgi:hypothetical protein